MVAVAINGYGNLGRGVERALALAPDMECVGVFTRRDPASVTTYGASVYALEQLSEFKGKIDVVINCGGSATDLEVQTPQVAKLFNVVDSFDTHAKIPQHFATVDEAAREAGTTAIISAGWDPGLFSMIRVLVKQFCLRGVQQPSGDVVFLKVILTLFAVLRAFSMLANTQFL